MLGVHEMLCCLWPTIHNCSMWSIEDSKGIPPVRSFPEVLPTLFHFTAYLLVKVFPVILCHQPKQREEGPTKWVKAGVIIVWVPSHSDAGEPLWTLPATNRESVNLRKSSCCRVTLCGNVNAESDTFIHGLFSFYIVHIIFQSSSTWGLSLPSFTAISTKQWISFAWKVIMITWWGKKENHSFAVCG